MTAYAIEQWQVEEAQAGVSARPKPEVREFNTDWWYDSPRYAELNRLFYSVSFHCRTVVAYRGWSGRSCPVIGLPSDLDYLDLLFTHLMLQMGRNLERHYDPSKPLDENVYDMRMAGMGWMRITELLWKAGPRRGSAREGGQDARVRRRDARVHRDADHGGDALGRDPERPARRSRTGSRTSTAPTPAGTTWTSQLRPARGLPALLRDGLRGGGPRPPP
jgi:hypothetical protein